MGEKYHAYRFIIQSLLKMAPRRPKEQVYAIFGDMFLTDDMVHEVGLPNTRLILLHNSIHPPILSHPVFEALQ